MIITFDVDSTDAIWPVWSVFLKKHFDQLTPSANVQLDTTKVDIVRLVIYHNTPNDFLITNETKGYINTLHLTRSWTEWDYVWWSFYRGSYRDRWLRHHVWLYVWKLGGFTSGDWIWRGFRGDVNQRWRWRIVEIPGKEQDEWSWVWYVLSSRTSTCSY